MYTEKMTPVNVTPLSVDFGIFYFKMSFNYPFQSVFNSNHFYGLCSTPKRVNFELIYKSFIGTQY
jgi:hypothetical protein